MRVAASGGVAWRGFNAGRGGFSQQGWTGQPPARWRAEEDVTGFGTGFTITACQR